MTPRPFRGESTAAAKDVSPVILPRVADLLFGASSEEPAILAEIAGHIVSFGKETKASDRSPVIYAGDGDPYEDGEMASAQRVRREHVEQ